MLHASTEPTPKNLSVHALAAWHGRARLVDVREPAEFVGELGHVPHAELVPLSSLPRVAESWDRGALVVVICRSGGRSAAAARTLEQMGFRAVMNLDGGMLAVNAAGLATTRR
jgi:rhodanese-related sulfurtransferase